MERSFSQWEQGRPGGTSFYGGSRKEQTLMVTGLAVYGMAEKRTGFPDVHHALERMRSENGSGNV